MLVGLNIILIIAIMGGAIAFIGDKLGTKIGKRRMSIFGLRPKHTSIIMTIVTGILISAFTLGCWPLRRKMFVSLFLVWSSCELKWIS